MTFELGTPWALALVAVPVVVLVWMILRRRAARPALRVPAVSLLASRRRSLRLRTRWLVPAGRLLVLLLVVAALARPRSGTTLESVSTEGIDIVVALDTSGSMLAEDMPFAGRRFNRVTAAKRVVGQFVQGRTADRIGLLSFDEITVPRCPPTLDYGVLLDFLDEVDVGDQTARTALGMALASAVGRLRESSAESRVVILVTDGRNNTGRIEPLDAAEMARLTGVKVYTVGVGREGMADFPVTGPFGAVSYRQVASDLDEKTLREISRITDGQYFRASDHAELERIFSVIDALEKTEIDVERHVRYDEHFLALVRLAAVLLAVILWGAATAWRVVP